MIKKSVRKNISRINGTLLGGIIGSVIMTGIFIIFYFSDFCSLPIAVSGIVLILAAGITDFILLLKSGRFDVAESNLTDMAANVCKVRKTYIMFIAIIAIIAAVVGFLIGFTINRRAVRAADDILNQIRELKEGK